MGHSWRLFSNSGALGTTPNTMNEIAPIPEHYLLVTNLPVWPGADGAHGVVPLWAKDLAEHLVYLPHFALAAPVATGGSPGPLESLSGLPLRVIALGPQRSLLRAVATVPRTFWRLWKAIGAAEVVHCGIAGWPIPMGWLAAPIARLRGKFLVIVVESAPWRVASTRKEKIRAAVFERMARWCVGMADIAFFTQKEYRDSMLLRRYERGHIIHASWIDAAKVLIQEQAHAAWREKPSNLRLLFAGRLTEPKGVSILLRSMEELSQQGKAITLDLLGEGPLLAECEKVANRMGGHVKIRLLGTLPYDQRFFEAMRSYHALIVPSLGDEQPRIVYDAYSQAVPVIASDTAGLRDCVEDRVTGLLAARGDSTALAQAIALAEKDRELLKTMGFSALQRARDMTHATMHRRRAALLREALDARQFKGRHSTCGKSVAE